MRADVHIDMDHNDKFAYSINNVSNISQLLPCERTIDPINNNCILGEFICNIEKKKFAIFSSVSAKKYDIRIVLLLHRRTLLKKGGF